jgi:hypothetical protein
VRRVRFHFIISDLSVEGICNKDLETSSQGVVASKLANAGRALFVAWEQEFIARPGATKQKERNSFTFLIELFSNVAIAVERI